MRGWMVMVVVVVTATPAWSQEAPVETELASQQPIYSELYNEEESFEKRGYMFADHRYWSGPVADPNAQLFYMGFYGGHPVRYTRAIDPEDDLHMFWDVGFGENFAIGGFDFAREDARQPAGIAFFIGADTHMLLDFDAESAAVVDTDYRLGPSIEGRGSPYTDALDFLAWRVRIFHESTHLGDEFVLAAREDHPAEFQRINVSYEALELMVSAGGLLTQGVAGMVYGGYRRLRNGPYEVDGDERGRRHEAQFGGEARLPVRPGSDSKRYIPKNVVLGADLTVRKFYRYSNAGDDLPPPAHLSAVFGGEWFNLAERGPTVRVFIKAYKGSNPRGQLRDQKLTFFGFLFQLDY